MKNKNIFRNSNGFFIFDFTCVGDLNALKIPTLASYKMLSIGMKRKHLNSPIILQH